MNAEPDIRIVDDFAAEAARWFAEWAQGQLAQRDGVHVALSGGSTPRAVYDILARPPYRDAVAWSGIHFYMGDERPVPHDHPDSNWGMAARTLLDPVAVPPANRHPMPTANADLSQVAAQYADALANHLPLANGLPRFDLIWLGLGTDGHTASLFPGTAALDESQRTVVVNGVPQLDTTRLTLTYPVINRSRYVVFLVAGTAKADIVKRVLAERDPSLPATYVRPMDGQLIWLIDREAGSGLDER